MAEDRLEDREESKEDRAKEEKAKEEFTLENLELLKTVGTG